MKKIAVFDLHHEVLAAWERFSRESGAIPEVLTLDFHTDVLNCAGRGIGSPADAAAAVEVLHHDEHFDWALRKKIISKAVILSLSPCSVAPEHPELEVRRREMLPEMDVMLNDPENFRPLADMVLDDRFLAPLLADGFPHGSFILDIDCDFFLTEKSLEPEHHEVIDSLAQRAGLITFSRENDWVKILKLPGEKITGEIIAARLVDRFDR